jgi:hypothetical protein
VAAGFEAAGARDLGAGVEDCGWGGAGDGAARRGRVLGLCWVGQSIHCQPAAMQPPSDAPPKPCNAPAPLTRLHPQRRVQLRRNLGVDAARQQAARRGAGGVVGEDGDLDGGAADLLCLGGRGVCVVSVVRVRHACAFGAEC